MVLMVVLLILAYLAVILFEVPGLVHRKYWRELVVFSCLLLVAFIISLIQALEVKIPSVSSSITDIVRAVFSVFKI